MRSSLLRVRALPFLFVALCLPLAALKAQPVITLSSSGYSVELGGSVIIDGVSVYGQAPFTYQWVEQGANNTTVVLQNGATANGSTLSGTSGTAGTSGTTNRTLPGMTLSGATAADAGSYAIEVTDANGGTATSAWIALTVKPAAPPTITNQPANTTVVAGNNAYFSVYATGSYPRTYQWYSGTPGTGSAIAGATNSGLTITGAMSTDAGSYYATVSNAYGSATSTAATLTVNPATPIAYSGSGSSQVAYVGQPLTLSLYPYTGSSPITFQWQKDGAAIAGATKSTYSISSVALGDAGTYTQVATNAAGTVTSPAITLTVNPAVPVTFPSSANPVTITSGQSLNLYMTASTGSPTITYQWQKDGVAISGATNSSFYRSTTTTADSGSYTVVGTNPAGSTTSPAIQVTVNPPVPPTITTQPANVTVAQGDSANFSVVAGGTAPFTFQWMKNGTPIANASTGNGYYSITSVQPADAGSYSVTVTNAAGSVTSSTATLTVLPPIAPSFTGYPSSQSVALGASLTLSAPYVSNYNNNGPVGPYTYQWFKDGAAISGATGSSYTIGAARLADAGTYTVAVTNAGGTADAPPTEVTVTPAAPTATAWLDAVQQGSIIYFLFAQHLERYDLSSASWLPGTTFSQTATAFCVAADGVYIGFGRALAKFPLDLSSQATLANLGDTVAGLFSLGNYVYAVVGTSSSYPPVYPVDRSTGAVGAAESVSVGWPFQFTAVAANKVYSAGQYSQMLTADSTGKLTSQGVNDYTFPRGTRGYALPDQQHFADNGGTIFNISDSSFAGTFGGSFTDMAFLSDGTPVVLRNNLLYTYAVGGLKETAHTALSVTGSRLFASGGNLFVFYPGTSSGNSYVGLTEVAAATINSSYTPAPAADASHLSFTAAATLQDAAGTVYLYDPAHENLFRWSPGSQAYLAPIPLAGAPRQIVYSGTLNAIYCVYSNGRVTRIDLGASAPAEQPFTTFPLRVDTATGADNFLYAILQNGGDSGQEQCVIDARTGAIVTFNGRGSYFASSYTWSSANQTLYGAQGTYPSGVAQPLSSSGALLPSPFQLSGGNGNTFPSPTGTRLIAASGQVYDATGLNIGVLGNAVADVAWLGGTPYTMRSNAAGGTELQTWSPNNFILAASAELTGTPVRLVSIGGNQLLAITEVLGTPTYTIVNASLQRVSTTPAAGASSGAPTFVTQPAPSLTVFSGTTVTLAVDTNGATPQTFQWYKNGSAIAGATNAALALSSVSSTDAANYYVTATNTAGAATSATTSLAVAPALTFTTQPQSQVMASGSATFTAAVANDTGASYQWYFNRSAVSGATSNTLVVSPISSSNWGTYVLKVSNTAGAVYSDAVTLLPPAPVITTQPQSTAITPGGSGSVSVSAQYATSYQWFLNGVAIPGATSATYWMYNVTTANAGTYTVAVTGAGGTTTSAAATVTVGAAPAPTITTQPQSMRVDPATNVTLSVAGTNVTSYQWYFNGAAISGATNSVLSIPAATSANSGTYTVTLTGSGGSVTSAPATLTVAYLPVVITQQPQSIVAPTGSNVQFLASGANIHSMQWYFNGTAIAGAVNAWLNLTAISAANVGSYYLVMTGVGGDTVTTNTVTLTLGTSTTPTITTQPQSTSVSAGGSLTLSVTGTNATAYQWYKNGTAISGATGATLVLNKVMPADAGTYTVALTGSGGTVTSNSAVVTVTTNSFVGTYFGGFAGGGRWALCVAPSGAAKFIAYIASQGAVVGDLNLAADGSLSVKTLSGWSLPGATLPNSLTGAISSGNVALNFGGASSGTLDPGTAALPFAGYYAADALNGATGESYVAIGGSGATFAIWVSVQSLMAPPDSASGTLGSNGQLSATSTLGHALTIAVDANTSVVSETLAASNNTVVAFGGLAAATTNTARLLNLSSRANVGTDVLITGFSIAGTGTKGILVRGVGPALKNYGLNDALMAPKVTFNDGSGTELWSGTSWGGGTWLINTFTAVGAFPLDPASADAAHTFITNQGRYTATISGLNGGAGIALAEVYDTDGGPNAARLVNLSARANVQAGSGVLTAGLIVGGNGPETVLLRGIGPGLKTYGIGNYLVAPQLTLCDAAGKPITTNTGWSDSGLTTNFMMSQVGAFQLADGSADCVIRATLMPGNYTVQVTSQDPTQTGVALVEVYEVP